MSEIVKSKIELLEKLLKALADAAYSVGAESNGVSDNEWRVEDGKAIPEWPVDSFYRALDKLEAARLEAKAYFEPIEAEKAKKWSDAIATATFIIDKMREAKAEGKMSLNLIESSLHRNIADAINGGLRMSFEDREKGIKPKTMDDRLNALVASGELVKIEPKS